MATGQYIKQNLLSSDIGTTVVRATLIPATTYEATTAMDCRGFRQVDFFIEVNTAGSIAKLTVKPESGQTLSSTTVEYATYLTETVSLGVATTYDYEIELNDPLPSGTPVYKVSLPVEGRYVRLSLKSDHVSGTVTIYATRRV
tara:strand:+ start:3635 stop:4063 length:429 start_codon:yes stop_codon:yes gene_type:complete